MSMVFIWKNYSKHSYGRDYSKQARYIQVDGKTRRGEGDGTGWSLGKYIDSMQGRVGETDICYHKVLIASGTVPVECKRAEVVPIYKNGGK